PSTSTAAMHEASAGGQPRARRHASRQAVSSSMRTARSPAFLSAMLALPALSISGPSFPRTIPRPELGPWRYHDAPPNGTIGAEGRSAYHDARHHRPGVLLRAATRHRARPAPGTGDHRGRGRSRPSPLGRSDPG